MRTSLALVFALAACGGSSNPTTTYDFSKPVDSSTGGGDMAVAAGDMATEACASYTTSSIASMRQGSPGCYELDNVIVVAAKPATSDSVTLYVQDSAGGLYSAVRVSCSSSSMSHPCADFATLSKLPSAEKITLKGTYIKSSASKGGYEAFYPDSGTDNGAGTAPAPAALAETDLERGTTMASTSNPIAAYYFQVVTAMISDKLVMLDWTPPEFVSSGTAACPKQFGWGMIPMSAGATAGMACSGTTQPAGQTTVNPKEVLVGTDFYKGFTESTDCACAAMYSDTLVTAGQGLSGSITALLDYDVPYGMTTGYLYVAPMTNAQFMIH